MRSATKTKVMCTIDSLFDFRLAALMLTQTNVFLEGIRGDIYCNRLCDDLTMAFPGFQKNLYLKRIAEYDSELMQYARLTRLAYFLAEDAELIDDNVILNPQYDNMVFHFNVYPFVLTPEAKKIIIGTLEQILSPYTEIEIVSFSIPEMTPKFLGDEYDTLFIYNYHIWISEHYEALLKNPIPSFRIHAPSLEINKHDARGNDSQEKVFSGIHRFKFLESMVAEFFLLRFLDTATFSIIQKPT